MSSKFTAIDREIVNLRNYQLSKQNNFHQSNNKQTENYDDHLTDTPPHIPLQDDLSNSRLTGEEAQPFLSYFMAPSSPNSTIRLAGLRQEEAKEAVISSPLPYGSEVSSRMPLAAHLMYERETRELMEVGERKIRSMSYGGRSREIDPMTLPPSFPLQWGQPSYGETHQSSSHFSALAPPFRPPQPPIGFQNNQRSKPVITSRPKIAADPNHIIKVTRKAVADETLISLRRGSYTLPDGREIDVTEQLKKAIEKATCYPPNYYFIEEVEARFPAMIIEVSEETTLQACRRLFEETGGNVGCLAFSSGKNPGGGFLGGSGGQEESIARSSGYYLCVIKDPQLYEYNRSHKDPFHSDHLIVSPEVPVIRQEAEPYTL
eukprot:gene4101-8156_t